jgi:hypothetical protein
MAINIHVDTEQYLYQGFTLIDITPTGVISYSPQNEFKRNQQRNWETVQQILGLRTQPTILETDDFVDDVIKYNFGIKYQGEHKIWTFKFGVDYADIYQDGPDKFGLIKNDFKITPVILNLTETILPELAVFTPKGPWNNIYFKSIGE